MNEFDGLDAEISDDVIEAAREELTAGRERAIERGRAYGAQEADSRRETGSDREQRIRRAAMRAAWEFDGRPPGESDEYRKEFGVNQPDVTGSLERAAPKPPK